MTATLVAQLVLFALCAILIGFTKAGWGAVLGTLPTVILLAIYAPQEALVLQLPLLILGDLFGVAILWRRWSWADARRILALALVVTVATSYFVSVAPSELMRRLIGGSTVLFAVLTALARRRGREGAVEARPGFWSGSLTGLLTGFLSGAAHAGGPPLTLYLVRRQLSVVTLAATYTLIFTVLNAVKIPAYLSTGMLSWESFVAVVWALPFVPLGLFIGRLALRKTSTERFTGLAVVFLFASGMLLILAP